MVKMSAADREIFEQSIYLPMVLSVLEYDRKVTEKTPFKLRIIYLNLIEHTMKLVQRDLKLIKDNMRLNKMKTVKGKNDGIFTKYEFYYKGYHEVHRYWNANLRNNTEKLLRAYFIEYKNN
ncbi:hypothetical protein [Bacillus sp. 03113]|uniref:hypothetical protein n=1 Tax=Bacillus sp. 03113 TaxID=2578211 RepID=UPI0011448584|nr:hypothetical protein [Bacillus sp. 03113]